MASAITRMPAVFVGHGSPMNTLETTATPRRGTTSARLESRARGHPRRLGALVHQRHRGHRDGQPEDDPRLLRLPRRAVRLPVPGARRARRWPTRSPSSWRPRGSGRTSTAGASTTAPGRCSPTCSPTADVPVRAAVDRRHQAVRRPPRAARRRAGAAARHAACSIVASGNVVHNLRRIGWDRPTAASTGPSEFDDDARRADDRPTRPTSLSWRRTATTRRRRRRPTTSCRCSTSRAWRRPPGEPAEVFIVGCTDGLAVDDELRGGPPERRLTFIRLTVSGVRAGRPRTRSPRMLRITFEVPPMIV